MIFPQTHLSLSGQRFTVTYRVGAESQATARRRATGICLEQTVELPETLLLHDDIRAAVVGRIESLQPLSTDDFEVVISYAVETAGNELTQLLNVIFGNTSMQPNIRVERISLPDALLQHYPGPKFGRAGLRKLVQAEHRPLLCTALKPMGLSAANLADLARQFALGGIDIVKDDHGLANQPFAPFKERVQRCADAVHTVNQQSGSYCLYVPNITAPAHQILENAYFAKQVGAGGVMVAPGLTGLDAIRQLAQDKNLTLPVFSHPALQGTRVVGSRQGMAHQLVFGQLPRLAGADATIYVNYGGRFAFSQADCRAIARATEEPMGHLKPVFPTPGGGMTLDRLPDLLDFYGQDVILLIAGGLYGHGSSLIDACRDFRERIQPHT